MARPEQPYIGDINLLRDYPPNTPLKEITDYEIFVGDRWVHASEAEGLAYPIFRPTGLLGKDYL